MEVIVIDGVEYVKASIIAKRFKYTADYVGQLCRAGKVDAKLVGRTWYVAPDSLTGHKSARYTKPAPTEKTPKAVDKVSTSRIAVAPVIRRSTARTLRASTVPGPASTSSANYLARVNWQPAKYEPDESELLPPLRTEMKTAKRLMVDLADAESLRVKSEVSRPLDLEPEPLPSIALGGTLRVTSLESNFSDPENDDYNKENIAISDIRDREEAAEEIHELKVKDLDKRISRPKIEIEAAEEAVELEKPATPSRMADRYTYDVPLTVSSAPATPTVPAVTPSHVSFAPASVRQTVAKSPRAALQAMSTPSTSLQRVLLWFVALICFIALSLILCVATKTTVTDGVFHTTYVFDLP